MPNIQIIIVVLTILGMVGGGVVWQQHTIESLTVERDEARINHENVVAGFTQYAQSVNDEIIEYQSKLTIIELEDQKAREKRDAETNKFSKHDFEQLVRDKPATLERLINAGTARMFNEIQAASSGRKFSDVASGERSETSNNSAVESP